MLSTVLGLGDVTAKKIGEVLDLRERTFIIDKKNKQVNKIIEILQIGKCYEENKIK